MALYEPNIAEFFSKFNTSVVKEFKFDQMNKTTQEAPQYEKEEEGGGAIQKGNGGQTTVATGDILRPRFAVGGQFVGLQVRPELA